MGTIVSSDFSTTKKDLIQKTRFKREPVKNIIYLEKRVRCKQWEHIGVEKE